MCCSRKQQQRLFVAGQPIGTQQLSARQQYRDLRASSVNNSPSLQTDKFIQPTSQTPRWTEYQPRTMAGILVMGVALGLQEGGKKIKEKRDERKAKKAALVSMNETNSLSSHFLNATIGS